MTTKWIARSKKTQMVRASVSAPVSYLVRNHRGLVAGRTVLNFGEGKAWQDSRVLYQAGADIVVGYDPNHAVSNSASVRSLADAQRLVLAHNQHWGRESFDKFDVAYCGYVFNTLPPEDRAAALDDAFSVAEELIVAVRKSPIAGVPWSDGVITRKGTFQKGWPNWYELEEEFVQPGDALGFNRLQSTSSYFLFNVYPL